MKSVSILDIASVKTMLSRLDVAIQSTSILDAAIDHAITVRRRVNFFI
jgi:hypothetical protein